LEASVVGLIGAAAGWLLGLGVAKGLTGLMDVDGGLAIEPKSIAIALGVGLVVTLVSALLPARRASKVPPIAAMRSVAVDTTGRSRIRFAIGLVLTALGVAAVVSGASNTAASTVGLGVGLAFLGLLFGGPGLARPVGAVVGWPLGRTRGVAGVLAKENARRNPRRSASTAQALMIGVGIVAFFMVINASIRASIDKTLDEHFDGDLIVDSGTFGVVGLPHDVAGQVGEVQDVEAVAPVRYDTARIGDGTVDIVGSTSDIFPIMGQRMVEGSGSLGDGEVVILDELARKNHLAVGDKLTFDFLDTGLADVTVAGIYTGPKASQLGDYVFGVDEMARHLNDDTDMQVFVEVRDGASLADVKHRIERITDPLVTAEVQTVDDYKDQIGGQLDIFLNLVMGLLLLAIVIALLGIANTVALSILERTREIGLLRAVGMSRRQLRSTIRWESVIIALFGTSLGLAVGVLGGWGMVSAFKDEGFEVFQVPYGVLVTVTLLAAACGMLAALVPAWRASRLDVLDAIHTE
jgi:putative ABC transport system permease protein